MHGGRTPQVKRAADLRLIALYQPAISTLAREMATAAKSADRIRAANSLLDRIGVARNSEMTAEQAMDFLLAEADKFRAELDAQAKDEARTIEGETA